LPPDTSQNAVLNHEIPGAVKAAIPSGPRVEAETLK